MKKLLVILSLILLSGIAIGSGITRTAFIRTGYTMLSGPFVCTANDTITASQTYTILITNLQQFQQHQQFYFDLTDVSGSANAVTITAYGKVTASGAWVQIGTPISWSSDSNDGYITSTTPINYNYFKIELVADGSEQKNLLAAFEVKTSNAAAIPANSGTYTFARATTGTMTITSQDNDANCATTYRAGGTGALTIGSTQGATTLTSDGTITVTGSPTVSGLITANGGLTLGSSDNLVGSSTSSILMNTDKFTVAGATGNTVIAGTLGVTGVTTATGGLTYATTPSVFWAAGGAVALATAGTDVACANGNRFWVEVNIPLNKTITGVGVLLGSVGGTDSICIQLFNSAGTEVATTRHGATGKTANLLGTTATFQDINFATPYAAVAGRYFVAVQFNGTTGKFRAYPIVGSKFITGTAAGTWGTAANITPGTTFTADKGPICFLY